MLWIKFFSGLNIDDSLNINPHNNFPILRDVDTFQLIPLIVTYQKKKLSWLTMSYKSSQINVTDTGSWRNVLGKLL